MSTGIGKGPGLDGAGSQNAGDSENERSGTASAGSGTVTSTGSASSSKKCDSRRLVPAVDLKILGIAVAVLMSMLGGMALL